MTNEKYHMTDSQKTCSIGPAMIDLPPAALVYQIEALLSYQSRRGGLSLKEWMDTKDFSPRERATLRAIWARKNREAS